MGQDKILWLLFQSHSNFKSVSMTQEHTNKPPEQNRDLSKKPV